MSSTPEERIDSEDLGFQAKKPVDIFDVADQYALRSTLEQNSIDCLAISNKHKVIFAYLEEELRVISTAKLSTIVESDEDESKDGLILHTFKIPGNVTQIKINSTETSLYLIIQQNTESRKVIVVSIDVEVLLRGNYNEKWISTFPSDTHITQLYPSPIHPNRSVCLLDNGESFMIDQSESTTSKLFDGVSAINWFDKYIVFAYDNDTTINFYDYDTFTTDSSFSVQGSNPDEKILYITQLDKSHLQVVMGESIGAEESAEYTTLFITLNSLLASKVESSAYLYAPYGVIPRVNVFYTLRLTNWSTNYPSIFITSSAKSIDIDFSLPTQSIELLNDSDRATMPMDEDTSDDDTPIGMVLDLSSTVNVKEPCKGVDESNPLPRVIILTNRGQLLTWNIWSKTDLLNGVKLPAIEATGSIPASSIPTQKKTEPSVEESIGSLSFGKPTTDKKPAPNPFGNSLFGADQNTSFEKPFGQSTSGGFGKKDDKPAFSQSADNKPAFGQSTGIFGSTPASNPFNSSPATNSPFGSSAIGSSTTAAPAANTPFGSSTGFGNTTFGVGGFRMGGSTTPAVPKPTTATSTTSAFGKSSFGAGAFTANTGNNSPFGNLSSGSGNSPFGGLGAKTESPFGGLGTKTESPFGGLGTKTESPFGSLKSTAVKSLFSQVSSSATSSASSKSIFADPKPKETKPAVVETKPHTNSIFGGNNTPNPFGTAISNPFAASTKSPFGNTPTFGANPDFGSTPAFGNPNTTSSGLFSKPTAPVEPSNLFNKVTAKIEEIEEKKPEPVQTTSKSKLSFETTQKIEELVRESEESEIEEEEEEAEEEAEEVEAEEIEQINEYVLAEQPEDDEEESESFEEIEPEELESDVDLGLDRNSPMLVPRVNSVDTQPQQPQIQPQSQVQVKTQQSQTSQQPLAAKYDFIKEEHPLTSKPAAKKESTRLIKEPRNLPLDSQCDDYGFDFELNSKVDTDQAIKNIILNSNIKFDGVSESYEDFIVTKGKFYDATFENIPELVAQWDEDRIIENAAKYKAKLKKAKNERINRLNELFNKNEERDLALIKIQEEAKRMSKVLNEQIEKRKEELEKYKEEQELESLIDDKLKQEVLEANVAMDLMKSEIEELDNLTKKLEEAHAKYTKRNETRASDEEIDRTARKEAEKIAEELNPDSESSEFVEDVEAATDNSEAEADTTFLEDEPVNEDDTDNHNVVDIDSADIEEAEEKAAEIDAQDSPEPTTTTTETGSSYVKKSTDTSENDKELIIDQFATIPYEIEDIVTDDILEAVADGTFVLDERDGVVTKVKVSSNPDKFGMIVTTTTTELSTINVNIVQTTTGSFGTDSTAVEVEEEIDIPATVVSSIDAEEENEEDGKEEESPKKPTETPKKTIKLQSRFADDSESTPASTGTTTTTTTKPGDNYVNASTTTDPKANAIEYRTEETATEPYININTHTEASVIDSTAAELEYTNVQTAVEPYVEVVTNTQDELVNTEVCVSTTYIVENDAIDPEYSTLTTEVDNMKIAVVSNFEDDEIYFSKHYLPLSLPLMHARGNVEYPADFEKLSPIGMQMKKLIYDVFIDFDVLHKNVESMNKYMTDQANDSIIYHTLENSSGFGNFWRFFEIGTILLGADRQSTVFNDMVKYYTDMENKSASLKSGLFSDFKKLSSYENSLDKISKKNLKFQQSYLDAKRPLTFENVKTRRALREKVQNLQNIDKTVQSEVLILKSQIYPEEVVKDDRAMNTVISSLQRNLYSHAEVISGLSSTLEKVKKAEEAPKQIVSEEQEDEIKEPAVSAPDVAKFPAGRLAHLAVRVGANFSLADVLRNKNNKNRYVSL